MHRYKKLLLISTFFIGINPGTAQQQTTLLRSRFDSVEFSRIRKQLNELQATDYIKEWFKENNNVLPYRLLKPVETEKNKKYPLVITLHNSSRVGNDNEKQLEPLARIWLRPEIRMRFPAYVVAPQFKERSSLYHFDSARAILTAEPADALYTLTQLVLQLKKQLNIDEHRIYLVGYSMGASAAQNLMSLRPDLFTAMVSIAGVPDFSNINHIRSKFIWLIHGNRDTENPFSGSQALYEQLKGDPNLHYTVCEGLDHNNITFPFLSTDAIPRWLFGTSHESLGNGADRPLPSIYNWRYTIP